MMFKGNAQPGGAHVITFHSLNVHETSFEYTVR